MKLLRSNLTLLNTFVLAGLFAGMAPVVFAASEAPKRLHANIDDSQTFLLKGNTRPAVALGLAQDQGVVAGSQVMPRMSVHFTMTAAQQTDLQQLLTAQQNRRSPQYRRFLTPEEYADRFGLNTADIEKVNLWLETNGFSNVQVARSRTWVGFSGTAAQAQSAFHTSIHNYVLNGEAHFANSSDPQLPKALQGMAESVRGLHNFRMKPHIRLRPRFTSSVSGLTYLAPDDWATIYDVKPLYGQGLDGTGITIAVMGQSDVELTDLRAFRVAAGLPAKDPTIVVPPGDADPGVVGGVDGDEGESDLDLEWSGAIAKNANILFITADAVNGNGVIDSITYAIDNNVAPILSTSYGSCEPNLGPGEFSTQNSLFRQANIQGMTIVAPSGDVGAADCDSGPNETVAIQGLAVDFPASSQYVTGVGGTTLTAEGAGSYFSSTNNGNNGSALSYIPEVVWNDGFQNATGGGASVLVTKPGWQTGTGVPNDGARDVPDLAFAASPNQDGLLTCSPPSPSEPAGTLTCINGGFRNSDTDLNVSGGTSTGPPTLAGILAMLVQKTGGPLGNINPNLYSLAAISTTVFHDITAGNNIVACKPGTPNCPVSGAMGYSAAPGYDQTTGWGSLDAFNFVEQWSGDVQLTASPATVTVQPGGSATTSVTVAPQNNFSGTVSFTCAVPSSLANVTCSIPGTVTNSGSTTLTITAGSTAAAPLLRLFRKVPPLAPWWLLAALALATAIFTLRKRHSAYVWSAAVFCILVLGAVSCGGGSSSGSSSSTGSAIIPAESGSIVVTATSGMIVNKTSVAVTVPQT